MTPKKKSGPAAAFPIRFTPDDTKLLERLQKKTGILSRADLIRQALRALADKEGLQ